MRQAMAQGKEKNGKEDSQNKEKESYFFHPTPHPPGIKAKRR